jgi:hypothetical protein
MHYFGFRTNLSWRTWLPGSNSLISTDLTSSMPMEGQGKLSLCKKELFNRFAFLERVEDLVNCFLTVNASVPIGFRVDDHDGGVIAQFHTARARDKYVTQVTVGEFTFQVSKEIGGTLLVAFSLGISSDSVAATE